MQDTSYYNIETISDRIIHTIILTSLGQGVTFLNMGQLYKAQFILSLVSMAFQNY